MHCKGFLTDEDNDNVPDTIYTSSSSVYSVYSGFNVSCQVFYDSQGIPQNASVTVIDVSYGWSYISFENPVNMTGITISFIDGFNNYYIASRNYWISPFSPTIIQLLDLNSIGTYTIYYTSIESISGLVVDNVTETTVSLTWNSSGGALYYQVYYKETGTLTWKLLGVTDENYFIVDSLKSSTSYTFEVIPGDTQFYNNFGAQIIASTNVKNEKYC